MADNFNMKQFLAENKLGAYSKLKEEESLSESEFSYIKGNDGFCYKVTDEGYRTRVAPHYCGRGSREVTREEKVEGYMGTQYDSSEDMAVDMVKKGLPEEKVEEAGQGSLMAIDRIEEIVNNLARNISTNSNIPTQEKIGLVQALKELKDLVEDLGANIEMDMNEEKKEEGYKGITEASGGLSPLHKQLIKNIVDNYFDDGIDADPAMERIERILNDDLSWEELDNEDLEDFKESIGGKNPEGDALVLRFLQGIAKKFNYPVSHAATFVKNTIKSLGY